MTVFSTRTLVFLLAALGLFRLLPRRRRPFLLLLASLLFYGLVQPGYLPLLVGSSLVVWGIALYLPRLAARPRRYWRAGGILLVLSPLLVFKYADLICKTAADLMGMKISPLHFLAPLGISFYTFRMISYLVDVSRRRCPPEGNPLYLLLYIAWFPQILSGPIERAGDLMDQLKHPAPPDVERGLRRILAGLFKKMVIAERLALFVTPLFRDPAGYAGINLAFGAVFFYLQIYCDFAGYTDLAVGVSELFGIHSRENFDHPLSSRSVSEFWRRWHMTLSFWLRDYIFLPLSYAGLRRTGKWSPRPAEMTVYIFATTLTMLAAGFWHGAGWNFVAWGLIHALYMSVSHLTRRLRRRLRRLVGLHARPGLRHRIQWGFTFVLLTFSWIFFRAGSVDQAFTYLSHISLKLSGSGWVHLGFTLVFALAFAVAETGSRRGWWQRLMPSSAALKAVLFALALCVLIVFSVDTHNEFIYFRF